jgi:L-asparaginase/Glu-tRNA(Gln) amidotransferase subunit D
VGGSDVRWTTVLEVARESRRRIADGCSGIVVTHGTDTIEETAMALDLFVHGDASVVVTGAMRNPMLPGADGAANLLAAISVEASPAARGLGTLVVLHDEVHAARYVRKTHTDSPSTFARRVGELPSVKGVELPLHVGRTFAVKSFRDDSSSSKRSASGFLQLKDVPYGAARGWRHGRPGSGRSRCRS